ncbi:hypothetical protein CLV56_1858 [Mumia flava]|uniref:Uncharacterized protein n=1 Tax=Mumia flava TaxID=1348852 RepID=A0A0B2B2F9_9ACTN|nr:hypothetical protein [Mumia flava]PJJ57622.1 hypothetical protein CLV56_1858 [Mumia flava]
MAEPRAPIGDAPRWVTVHVLVLAATMAVAIAAGLLLGEDASAWVRGFLAVAGVANLLSLARQYGRRRDRVDGGELTYVRLATVFMTLLPTAGYFLTWPVGIALLAWTFLGRRHRARADG